VKSRFLLSCLVYFAVLAHCSLSVTSGEVVTFDDLVAGTNVPNGYQGLNWGNFDAENPLVFPIGGYRYGMVSPSNVAFNGFGNPAEIDAIGTKFNFLGAYLTGAWYSNLNVQIEGFRGGSLVYNLTVQAAATNATLFTFNYLDIDRLYFDSYGGDNAGFGGNGEQFVMDNFMFEFIPEPSSFLLAALAAVSLAAVLRRKRR